MNVIKIGSSFFDKGSINSIYAINTGENKNSLIITFIEGSDVFNHTTMKGKAYFQFESLSDRVLQRIISEIEQQLKEELGL